MHIDRIGEKFNKLEIIGVAEKSRVQKYICKCDCGNLVNVTYSSLKRESTKSCGCLRKERSHLKLLNFVDITGEKYNRLTAIQFVEIDTNSKDSIYLCECECGNTLKVPKGRLRSGNTKSCGCLKLENKREKHWRWRDDLSDEDRINSKFRTHSPEYIEWRKLIFERDNYTCQISGQVGGDLCAHHIIDWAGSVETRYLLSNGITLSKIIHEDFHKKYGKGKNTLDQYIEYKTEYKKEHKIDLSK